MERGIRGYRAREAGDAVSLRWEHAKADGISLAKVPADWSAYDRLVLALLGENQFQLHAHPQSENPETEGPDYYSRSIRLNFTGWKRFRCLPQMSAAASRSGGTGSVGYALPRPGGTSRTPRRSSASTR